MVLQRRQKRPRGREENGGSLFGWKGRKCRRTTRRRTRKSTAVDGRRGGRQQEAGDEGGDDGEIDEGGGDGDNGARPGVQAALDGAPQDWRQRRPSGSAETLWTGRHRTGGNDNGARPGVRLWMGRRRSRRRPRPSRAATDDDGGRGGADGERWTTTEPLGEGYMEEGLMGKGIKTGKGKGRVHACVLVCVCVYKVVYSVRLG